jgi:hypothetical protein
MEPYKLGKSNWDVLLKYPLSSEAFYKNLLVVDFKMHPVHSALLNIEILEQNDFLGDSPIWNKLCSGSCTNLFILNEGFNYRLIYEDYRNPFISSLKDLLMELGMEEGSYEYYVVIKSRDSTPASDKGLSVRYDVKGLTNFRLVYPKFRRELDFQWVLTNLQSMEDVIREINLKIDEIK